jgi:hypothetical protein
VVQQQVAVLRAVLRVVLAVLVARVAAVVVAAEPVVGDQVVGWT